MVVDQHPLTCKGLVSLINRCNDLEVCATASTRKACFHCMRTATPDLVVTELAFGDIDGIELIRHLTTMMPKSPLMVFSVMDEQVYAPRVYRAGARGFLPKSSPPGQLLDAMREILAGNLYFPCQISEIPPRKTEANPGTLLSDRELELFRFIGKGYPTRKLAEAMQLSEHTVNTYRLQIKTKLRLDHHAQLVQQAAIWEDRQS